MAPQTLSALVDPRLVTDVQKRNPTTRMQSQERPAPSDSEVRHLQGVVKGSFGETAPPPARSVSSAVTTATRPLVATAHGGESYGEISTQRTRPRQPQGTNEKSREKHQPAPSDDRGRRHQPRATDEPSRRDDTRRRHEPPPYSEPPTKADVHPTPKKRPTPLERWTALSEGLLSKPVVLRRELKYPTRTGRIRGLILPRSKEIALSPIETPLTR